MDTKTSALLETLRQELEAACAPLIGHPITDQSMLEIQERVRNATLEACKNHPLPLPLGLFRRPGAPPDPFWASYPDDTPVRLKEVTCHSGIDPDKVVLHFTLELVN